MSEQRMESPGRLELRRMVLGQVLLAVSLLLTSCGWHAGAGTMPMNPLTQIAYAPGTTIGVELFDRERNVLERNLEPVLHASITRALIDYQGLALRPADEAELVLRGTVLDYRRRDGVRSTGFELLETGVYLRFRADLVERATGTVVASSEPRTWSSYALDGVERESTARERGFEFLARKLVFELFSEASRPEDAESVRTSDTALTSQ